MTHSTATRRLTPTEQLDTLVADHARVSIERDRLVAERDRNTRALLRVDALAIALDIAEDDGATAMSIRDIRGYLGRAHVCGRA